MDYQEQRAYILANFQEYRTIQPTVIFLHGLPTALSQKEGLTNELQRIGIVVRVSLQSVGKDFFTAFVEFSSEVNAALAITTLDRNWLMNREIRAFYGSTKFCPHYLKGHTCRLQECNYAHYFHPFLTHLKDQTKDIDHQAIAHIFLTQHFYLAQQALSQLLQANYSQHFLLPINLDKLSREFYGNEEAPFAEQPAQQQHSLPPAPEAKPVQQQEWGLLSTQIESAVQTESQLLQKQKRSRIQQFLDGAQRFLTNLIFQSSNFVY